ncbi:hypothetical protein NK6_6683 [Bradyrhizobium diazoefficiens]|uniref:Uncharacterized protein n=1 Tax=Bradyrhizobium diazoefficiens TaxID=1355477 RepID=A0A0E4FXV6_9BRAD|nr:hypothetical protein NK6_6683 [Bradyrhizobium diazoefficiens]
MSQASTPIDPAGKTPAESHISSCPHDVHQPRPIVLENAVDRCDTLYGRDRRLR